MLNDPTPLPDDPDESLTGRPFDDWDDNGDDQ